MIFRPFIWLSRIRHRRGYGVHSPFAFRIITDVIYQRLPYYQYTELAQTERRLQKEMRQNDAPAADDWLYESQKVKRLLFRLVNEVQPATLVDYGRLSASALYLKAACRRAAYIGARRPEEIHPEAAPIDFLYLHAYRRPQEMQQVFERCIGRTRQRSLFVIEGIGRTSQMRKLWKSFKSHPQTGITFDLYDLGLIFFDKEKIKQDYIICF